MVESVGLEDTVRMKMEVRKWERLRRHLTKVDWGIYVYGVKSEGSSKTSLYLTSTRKVCG